MEITSFKPSSTDMVRTFTSFLSAKNTYPEVGFGVVET